MIDALPLTRQAVALGISRSGIYYTPAPPSEADVALMRCIDALHPSCRGGAFVGCGACSRPTSPASGGATSRH